MTVVVGLLIGHETWQLLERSLRSLRQLHPDQGVLIYHSLESAEDTILKTLQALSTRTIHSMDMLAAQPSQRELAAAAVSSFCADVATEPN